MSRLASFTDKCGLERTCAPHSAMWWWGSLGWSRTDTPSPHSEQKWPRPKLHNTESFVWWRNNFLLAKFGNKIIINLIKQTGPFCALRSTQHSHNIQQNKLGCLVHDRKQGLHNTHSQWRLVTERKRSFELHGRNNVIPINYY